jgi:hypothetical protein
VDTSGNYQLQFATVPTDIPAGTPHIHVKEYTDLSYNGYSPRAIMDYFIRLYPDVAMQISSVNNNSTGKNDNNSNPFSNSNPAIKDSVLESNSVIELIAQYYLTMCENKQKTEHYKQTLTTNMAAEPLYENHVEQYNREYRKVLNLSAGILIAIACIYNIVTTTR